MSAGQSKVHITNIERLLWSMKSVQAITPWTSGFAQSARSGACESQPKR